MKDKNMSQYLSEIKAICNAITTIGFALGSKDIILYTLNGLSSSYQAFKTSIKTNLQPMSLDDFYVLLCNKEINISNDAAEEPTPISTE